MHTLLHHRNEPQENIKVDPEAGDPKDSGFEAECKQQMASTTTFLQATRPLPPHPPPPPQKKKKNWRGQAELQCHPDAQWQGKVFSSLPLLHSLGSNTTYTHDQVNYVRQGPGSEGL